MQLKYNNLLSLFTFKRFWFFNSKNLPQNVINYHFLHIFFVHSKYVKSDIFHDKQTKKFQELFYIESTPNWLIACVFLGR
jgi:hypothetical protein